MDDSRILKHKAECRTSLMKDVNKSIGKVHDKINSCDLKKTKDIADLDKKIDVFINVTKLMNKNQNKGFDRLEKLINNFIDKSEENFVTKEEHRLSNERIAKIEKGVWKIIRLVGGILITSILYTIIK